MLKNTWLPHNSGIYAVPLLLCCMVLWPEAAWASGITDFAGPLEKVAGTVTGPVGRWVSVIGMGLVGLLLIFQRSEMTEGIKMLCGVVFAICFIAFAANIVNALFSFTGAVA